MNNRNLVAFGVLKSKKGFNPRIMEKLEVGRKYPLTATGGVAVSILAHQDIVGTTGYWSNWEVTSWVYPPSSECLGRFMGR